MKNIPFNQPPVLGTELGFIQQAIATGQLSGDGKFSRLCEQWLEQQCGSAKALLTPSCTAALELAAILLDVQAGDEVIMPSYTFVSTANAFVLRGAKIIFVDIHPETMNLDTRLLPAAITAKTKVIVAVHYAGVACEMAEIMALADKHRLWVVEDAAQAVMASYQGKMLGSWGHIGCLSFHETKNMTSGGEGGAILLNDPNLIERAEIIREKGTDRSRFFRGQVDKYRWQDVGSSFLPSELQAAYLYAQFQQAQQILQQRLALWQRYYQAFQPWAAKGRIELASISDESRHNAHLFFLKMRDCFDRQQLIATLASKGVMAVFHYVPLHSSPAGQRFGQFCGQDRFTTVESERLVRLPLFFNLTFDEQDRVISAVQHYLEQR